MARVVLQQKHIQGEHRADCMLRYFQEKLFLNLIFMDPCIIDDSVEIRFVIEFIIPKFTEGSTRFKRHTAHHQEL